MRFLLVLVLAISTAFSISAKPSKAAVPLGDAFIDSPMVIELFTSQSCSSCPRADSLLEKLAQNENIIALGCHVTYWDHLSWKDTLSQDFCTARQRAYQSYAGRNNVFTPELLINGSASTVGADYQAVATALHANDGKIKPIRITRNGDELHAVLPAIIKASAIVAIIHYGKPVTQSIGKGENRGRTQHYVNPVTHIQEVKKIWRGEQKTLTFPVSTLRSEDAGIALLVQEKNLAGPVLAAGKYIPETRN